MDGLISHSTHGSSIWLTIQWHYNLGWLYGFNDTNVLMYGDVKAVPDRIEIRSTKCGCLVGCSQPLKWHLSHTVHVQVENYKNVNYCHIKLLNNCSVQSQASAWNSSMIRHNPPKINTSISYNHTVKSDYLSIQSFDYLLSGLRTTLS